MDSLLVVRVGRWRVPRGFELPVDGHHYRVRASQFDTEVLPAISSGPVSAEDQLDSGHPSRARQLALEDVPDDIEVDSEIGVYGSTPETGDVVPGDLGIVRS